jgi:uncharacterized membrane protein YhaH (DUF805 family)
MPVPRRTLLHSLIVSVVLVAVAAPLGTKTHGLGKRHPVVAVVRDVVFSWFLISTLTFIALVAVFAVQRAHDSRRHAERKY